jgi:NAD(P)-dependent dehydrogenase (short-subunit alcohol dehydrogenase family)
MNGPVVLVTGGSSGIGRLTVQALAPHTAAVYAASRREPSFEQGNVHWLPMDVADPASIRSGVERVRADCGRIDVLVNNAGAMLGGLLEETGLELARRLFDTNFWGAVELTAQVLPLMRQRRRGHVIFVGSLAGRVGTPGQGFYAAGKFALAGYAETLAAEVEGFGIAVHLVEPGFHRTALHDNMLAGGDRIDDYEPVREEVRRRTRGLIAGGDDPARVAREIERLVLTRPRGLSHAVGRDARWVPWIKQLVPSQLFRAVLRRKFGLIHPARSESAL